jgi:hypothetical protein
MVELEYRVIRGHGLRKSQDTSCASNLNPVLFLTGVTCSPRLPAELPAQKLDPPLRSAGLLQRR